ncbi:hypothetical protein EJ06DRAFT_331205 [Trichodelitschia bisporula]|uniref:Uncharacterized protein n=1 Tax=Trichodelitschia bisporula TaxID=703511 RepID=A0A6G1I2G6_9PEZI|nr:hypothetical protein EJ06DRAFT_331205 [Trichodelitschia bisporula]
MHPPPKPVAPKTRARGFCASYAGSSEAAHANRSEPANSRSSRRKRRRHPRGGVRSRRRRSSPFVVHSYFVLRRSPRFHRSSTFPCRDATNRSQ